ncbi:hypothetical protein ACTMMA_15110 [Ornithinimicrobium panacihumi]
MENLLRYGKHDLTLPLLLEHAGPGDDLAVGAARVLPDWCPNACAATWRAGRSTPLSTKPRSTNDLGLVSVP